MSTLVADATLEGWTRPVTWTRKIVVGLAVLLLFRFLLAFFKGPNHLVLFLKISVYPVFIVISIHPHGTANNRQMSCTSFPSWLARRREAPDDVERTLMIPISEMDGWGR